MTDAKPTKSVLRKYGAKLIENGYSIIPIPHGKKGPVESKWQKIEANKNLVRTWTEGKYLNGNIGFLTKHTPAVDIDITDAEMSALMAEHTQAIVGKTITRVGRAPKTMLIYRTSVPFHKRKLTFLDDENHEQAIEVLGDGQQFVGIGIHPDTKKAYKWRSLEESPVGIHADKLPEITVDHIDELFDVFKIEAQRRGWTLKKHSGATATEATGDDEDDGNDMALLSHKRPLENITEEQIREILTWVPDVDEYEQWLRVGMALHHQFDGNEEGLALWHEWSETGNNYDSDALEAKWASFHDEMGRNITTVATLIKIAKEHRTEHANEQFEKILRKVSETESQAELLGPLATKWGGLLEHDYQVDMLSQAIVERVKELSGKRIRIDIVRKSVTEGFRKATFNYKELPHWCEDVVYVDTEEEFFYPSTRTALSERAFNARNNRHLLTKKDRSNMEAVPEQPASALALNVYQVPIVSGYVYLPGADRMVDWSGQMHINLYNEQDLAPIPEKLTNKDKKAIEVVKKHFEISYPVAREREILLSWLSYTLKRMDKKIRWAVVVQGVDGGGKGFIGEMLMAIMSKNNVVTVNAQRLDEKYTEFYERSKVVVFEEARISGTSRHAVMDKLKPYITNDVVDIRKMYAGGSNVPSVTCTMILTNHADALPVYDADRRYFVISTYFQTAGMLRHFRESHPDHFDDLFEAISYHPGAIREWLEDYPLHEEFDPNDHAPMTEAKGRMMDLARGDDEDEMWDLIEAGTDPEVNTMLLNVSRLRELATDQSLALPFGPKLANFLQSKGFVYVGRARDGEGKQCRYWSRVPEKIVFPNLQAWIDDWREVAAIRVPELAKF